MLIALKIILAIVSVSDLLGYFLDKTEEIKQGDTGLSKLIGVVLGIILRALIVYFIFC